MTAVSLEVAKTRYCLECECAQTLVFAEKCWNCGGKTQNTRPKWWPEVNGPRMFSGSE